MRGYRRLINSHQWFIVLRPFVLVYSHSYDFELRLKLDSLSKLATTNNSYVKTVVNILMNSDPDDNPSYSKPRSRC